MGRSRTWLLVAAVAAVVAVPLALRAGADRATTEPARRSAPRLVARWVPTDLTFRGTPRRSGGLGPAVGGVLQRTDDPTAEVVTITLTAARGRRVGWPAADEVRGTLGRLVAEAGTAVTVARAGRGFVALARGSGTIGDARDAVSLLDDGGAAGGRGWQAVGPVTVGWLPGVAATTTTSFGQPAGGRGLVLAAVAAPLPHQADLAPLVGAVDPLRLPGADGWTWAPSPGQVAAVWPLAPDVLGVVTATGLDPGELARVVRSART
jgi:hypothetical protein